MLGIAADILTIISFIFSTGAFIFSRSLFKNMQFQKIEYNTERANIQTSLKALRKNIWDDNLDTLKIRSRMRQELFSYFIKYWNISSLTCIFHLLRSIQYSKKPINGKQKREQLCISLDYLIAYLDKKEISKMMKDIAFELISKLIQKTKQQSIKWKRAQPTTSFKPTTSVEYGDYLQNLLSLDIENSYYADCDGGQFFLIVDELSQDITLIVQTPLSSHSMVYACTLDNSNLDTIAELKRLYYLVDSIDYDVSAFVNEFINQD